MMGGLGHLDRALKIATRATIHGCGGGEGAAATIAAVTGCAARQQRMSDCGNVHKPADFLRVNEVGHLEDVAARDVSWPAITRALAARQGFDLVPIYKSPRKSGDWLSGVSALAHEAGDVVSQITAALTNGAVEEGEAAVILSEIEQLSQVVAALRAMALCQGEGG